MCQDIDEYDPFEVLIIHEGWGEYESYIYIEPMEEYNWEEFLEADDYFENNQK